MKSVTFVYKAIRYTATKIGDSWRLTSWGDICYYIGRKPVGKFSTLAKSEAGVRRAAIKLVESKIKLKDKDLVI